MSETLRRKKVLIRVDGYNKIGLGHIYRTIVIANHLNNHDVLFVSKKEHTLGINLLKENNHKKESFSNKEEFERIIRTYNPDIIINDILDTDMDYIEQLKERQIFVVNFEDLGEGAKSADLVINALYDRKNFFDNHYWGKDYYILRKEFHQIPQKRNNEEVNNILITFGGTDPNNYTEKVLHALNNNHISNNIEINIILGLGCENLEKLEKDIISLNLNISIKHNVNNISKYMYEADIAFTSAGRTVYELASIGIPTIVLAQNERELLHTFANEENGFLNLGLGYNVSNDTIRKCLEKLILNYEFRNNLTNRMLEKNLRNGINKVIDLIFSHYEKYIKAVNL